MGLLEFWWTELGENSHSLKPGEPATLVYSSCRTSCRTFFFSKVWCIAVLVGILIAMARIRDSSSSTNMDASNNSKELTSCLLKLLSPKLLLLMYLCIFVYFAAPFGVKGGVKMRAIAEAMNKFIRSPLIRWCLRLQNRARIRWPKDTKPPETSTKALKDWCLVK